MFSQSARGTSTGGPRGASRAAPCAACMRMLFGVEKSSAAPMVCIVAIATVAKCVRQHNVSLVQRDFRKNDK